MTLPRFLAALALAITTTACDIYVDLDDDDRAVDGTLIVFDAAIDAPTDAPFDQPNCALELPCPPPDAGKATICGRLWDTQTDEQLRAATTTGARCTAVTGDGPCSLRMQFYDALDFAMNPSTAVPLPAEEAFIDDCGRYRGHNMPRATFGFIGISVDDGPGTLDRHALTAVATSNGLAAPGTGFRAYATRHATDAAWTTTSGTTGQSLATRGVLLNVFAFHGVPVAGVSVTRNGSLIPNDDHYFSDAGVSRSTIDPQRTATGANGSALIVNSSSPIAHSAVGGLTSPCQWPSSLGASIPGVVFVQIKEAETPSGTACP